MTAHSKADARKSGARPFNANVRAYFRAEVILAMRHEPTKTSQSRIKGLRGLARPQYRLRVEEVRVFYDVSGSTVEVLAIVAKSEAQSWLAQFGSPVERKSLCPR